MYHPLCLLSLQESFDYAFHVRGGTGLKVALIDHRDKAVIKQDGFYVSPGKENSIALVPSILNTTERAMSSLTPEERDCYTDQEFQFKDLRPKNGYRYHIKTCMYQALITKVVDNCGCKPGFIHTSMKTTPYCQGESLGICYKIRKKMNLYFSCF